MKVAGFIYGLTNGPRGWSAFLHFYYKKIVAQTMALVCTTNVSMFFNIFSVLISYSNENRGLYYRRGLVIVSGPMTLEIFPY